MDLRILLPFVGGIVIAIAVAILFSYLTGYFFPGRNFPGRTDGGMAHRRSRLRVPAADDLFVSLSGRGFSDNRVPIENASFDGIALRWDRLSPPQGSTVHMTFAGTSFAATVICHADEILRLRYKSSVTPSSAELIRSACLHGRNTPLTKLVALSRG